MDAAAVEPGEVAIFVQKSLVGSDQVFLRVSSPSRQL